MCYRRVLDVPDQKNHTAIKLLKVDQKLGVQMFNQITSKLKYNKLT